MIITISGPIGSGKTTVARAISERFGLKYISAGTVFRQMASDRGMSLEEFSTLAENDPDFDKEIDETQKKLANEGNAVVEGRLSGWLIDSDIKIWLGAPLEVRIERVAGREEKNKEKARKETVLREQSEKKRYKEIYNIDMDDISPYHVVLDTSLFDAQGVVEIIESVIASSKQRLKS